MSNQMIIEVSIYPKYTPGWGANFNVRDKNNKVVYDGTPTRIQGKGYRELTELRFTLSRNNFSSLIFWANSLRGDLSTSTSTDSFTQLLVNGEVEYVSRTNFRKIHASRLLWTVFLASRISKGNFKSLLLWNRTHFSFFFNQLQVSNINPQIVEWWERSNQGNASLIVTMHLLSSFLRRCDHTYSVKPFVQFYSNNKIWVERAFISFSAQYSPKQHPKIRKLVDSKSGSSLNVLVKMGMRSLILVFM